MFRRILIVFLISLLGSQVFGRDMNEPEKAYCKEVGGYDCPKAKSQQTQPTKPIPQGPEQGPSGPGWERLRGTKYRQTLDWTIQNLFETKFSNCRIINKYDLSNGKDSVSIYFPTGWNDVVELSVQEGKDVLHIVYNESRYRHETTITSTPDRSGIATFEYMQTKEVVHSTYQGTMDKPKLVEASETVIVKHVSCSTKKLLPLVVE